MVQWVDKGKDRFCSAKMEERVQTLFSLLQSKQTNRGNLAGDSALDLYTYCVESVSDTDIGELASCILPLKTCTVNDLIIAPVKNNYLQ